MKATNFLWDDPSLAGAWAKLTHALIFDPLRREREPENRLTRPAGTRSSGILERIDRWFWRPGGCPGTAKAYAPRASVNTSPAPAQARITGMTPTL